MGPFESDPRLKQCDQMLDEKVAQFSPKVTQIVAIAINFYFKSDVLQTRPKSCLIFGLLL